MLEIKSRHLTWGGPLIIGTTSKDFFAVFQIQLIKKISLMIMFGYDILLLLTSEYFLVFLEHRMHLKR